MRTFLDCAPCFVRQALNAVRLATSDEGIHEEVLRRVLLLVGEMDMSQSPPAMGQQIHRLIREMVHNDDPYRKIKSNFNNVALRLYPKLRKRIMESDDPLETAVRLAIAGNIIDLGVNGSVNESDVGEAIGRCLEAHFDKTHLPLLKEAAENAREILYLADNAGEIVFDRLLIEQLPVEKVTVVVRGSPVINDATMDDADVAGLTRIVEVVDNGSDAPGTIVQNCSEDFRRRFEAADMIIAKGQGNYETLNDEEKNIFFILVVKCPTVAADLGCGVGEMILRNSES